MSKLYIDRNVILKAPVSRVWKALTDSKEFGEWFGVNLTHGFVPGEHTAGNITYPGCEHVEFDAEVVRMEPESALSWRWHPYAVERGVDYSAEPRTLVELRLESIPEGTRLSVRESGFDDLPPHRRDEAFQANDEGWAEQMENIRNYLKA